MQAKTHAVALLVVPALFSAFLISFPEPVLAQTSVAPLHGREPTGLLGPDEAWEVTRAMDEAKRRTGRTIHVDVVVDDAGRRVSTGWIPYTPHEGAVHATETPMPMPAEDVNAPNGIVILVDPFGGKSSFVEAPGLSDSDERYLSGLMTHHFRRGSYDDGLIATAHWLGALLTPPVSRPLPPDPPDASETGRVSGVAVAIFGGGIAAVLLLLGYFLKGERYRQPRGPDMGVGFVAARRDAEASLSALAPRVMLLAEREMAVICRLRNFDEGTPDGPSRRHRAEALLRRAVSGAFWEDFVAATSLIEQDPEEALPELRRLSVVVEAALGGLREAERALGDPQDDARPGGSEGHLTGRDENYG